LIFRRTALGALAHELCGAGVLASFHALWGAEPLKGCSQVLEDQALLGDLLPSRLDD
jgi:hypothetical protein